MGDAGVDWKQRACDYFDTLQEVEEKCKEHQIARETADERSRDLYAEKQRAVDTNNHKDRQIRDLQLEKASLQRDVEQLCQGLKVRSAPLPQANPAAISRSCVPLSCCIVACGSPGTPAGRPKQDQRSRNRSHTWNAD